MQGLALGNHVCGLVQTLAKELLGAFGHDGAGGDGIDADPVAANLARHGAGHADDRSLAHGVVHAEWEAIDRGQRRYVDDRAATGLAHVADHGLAAVPDAGDVHVHHLLPLGRLQRFEAAALHVGIKRGVVHQRMNSAELLDCRIRHRLAGGHVGHVQRHAQRLAARGFDGRHHFAAIAEVAADDIRAFLCQCLGIGAAEPAGGAGNNGCFAGHGSGHA